MDDIDELCGSVHLSVFGAFQPEPADKTPDSCRTLVLLGPKEPGFWAHLNASQEWQDGSPDPVDRWSERVIGALAKDLGAQPLFPFGKPPYHPFYSWALRTGRAWRSPVSLLVHDTAGLMVSYRGALALPYRLNLPDFAIQPCATCAQPCLNACKPRALTGDGYDLDACHAFLETDEGRDNINLGCAVRRSCPVSQSYGRLTEQSAYHMSIFHR